jgi:hypothetical protein
MPTPNPLRLLATSLLLGCCIAQEPAPAPALGDDRPHFVVRRYPEHKDAAIAVVGSRTLTLGDLVDHIDARHQPGFRTAVAKAPEIQRMLQSDLIAPWVRHFADLEALRQTFPAEFEGERKAALEAAQSAALKARFQAWLDQWVADKRDAGRPVEPTQEQINRRLSDFQLKNGLACELQGALDHLEPGGHNRVQLQNFFNENARAFGGRVDIAHILIQHRDAGTGILLDDAGLALANTRLADIKARLRPDGSNFAEVAARSDDQRTAANGGVLKGVHRYDDRLPPALCRAAWSLRDGEISDVVETQYGWHIVRRLEFTQNIIILFTDDAIPTVRTVMQRALQEQRLFDARAAAGVRLLM